MHKGLLVMCDQSLPLDGLQVLVVDSDPDSRYLLKLIVEEYGIETIAATWAGKALETLKQVKPDLLISEIPLPKEDGYLLMSKVKALEIAEQVQIPALSKAIPFALAKRDVVQHGAIAAKGIALTVYAREDDRAHALSVGFEDHLPKPFNIDELITMVACLTQHVQWVPTT